MKRMILTGTLALATGFSCLMAQQAPAQPAGQAPKGPAPKSQAEAQALQAVFQAANAPDNPDGIIKAADDLLTKFADTDFKEIVYMVKPRPINRRGTWIRPRFSGSGYSKSIPRISKPR